VPVLAGPEMQQVFYFHDELASRDAVKGPFFRRGDAAEPPPIARRAVMVFTCCVFQAWLEKISRRDV